MKNSLFYILLSVLIGFVSCSNKEVEEMVSSVDSTLTLIKSTELNLLSIDTTDIGQMMSFSTTSLAFIQENFTDTATKEQAMFLSDIVAVKRSFSKLLSQREALINDMVYAKTQLSDLKEDVNNKVVDRKEFDTYFETEKQAIELFINSVASLEKWKESNTARFNRMKPQIEEFMASLNKNGS